MYLYLFALSGAGCLLVGKILIGAILVVCSFLISLKAMKYEYSRKKQTELIAAIYNRETEHVSFVLAQGADPNQADKLGNTPLAAAKKHWGNKSSELCELLKQHGARS